MHARKLAPILVLALVSTAAAAQISPGPLAPAHQDLEGATRCTTCHKLGGEPVFSGTGQGRERNGLSQ
ncbi:MAG: hypothetical protein WAQ52_18910 [Terriglobales bacterium]